jgi:LysR family transcriptional regulator, glycine cleavage system transcriptional activator
MPTAIAGNVSGQSAIIAAAAPEDQIWTSELSQHQSAVSGALTYAHDRRSDVCMTHSVPSLPPLEGLQAVLVAAREGSFSIAADTLGVTHGAISRRIATVEAWLGTAVFERHGRGVRLTPAGQRFARQIEQALDIIERTSERWRPPHGRATVRLSVVPSFAKLWMLSRLAALLEHLPDVRVELVAEHRVVDLEAGEADVAVRYGRGGWPGVDVRPLFGETLLPAASPTIAKLLGEQPSPEALARYPLLHDSDTSQWRAWFADAGINYSPRIDDRRFEDYDLVLAAAEGSLGLTLLRLPLAQDWLDNGRLMAISARSRPNPLSHHVVYRQGERRQGVLRIVDALCQSGSGPTTVTGQARITGSADVPPSRNARVQG